jgi:hypothetical protein
MSVFILLLFVYRPHPVLSIAGSFPESAGVLSSSLMSREPSYDDTNVAVIEVNNCQHVSYSSMLLDYQGAFNFNFIEILCHQYHMWCPL